MKSFLDCWISVASTLFSQALAGGSELTESLPTALVGASFGFVAEVTGDAGGRFTVTLDPALFDVPLLGEGVDQIGGWEELLREVADSAASELFVRSGKKCRVERFKQTPGEAKISVALQLRSAGCVWTILVHDDVCIAASEEPVACADESHAPASAPAVQTILGVELLLDVELEAALRFGCREMPLGEILDLGPGDVVELDRHISDPVDLIVGDKIVARGEVVLVNGNFGLRIMEVAAPRKRLENIRCLF